MDRFNSIFLTSLLAVGAVFGAPAEELTLDVAEPGTLSALIPEGKKYSISKLTLTGTINGLDWQTIREMAGCDYNWNATSGILEELDIADVTIVGGDPVVVALGSDASNPIIIRARDNALSEELFTSTKIKHIVMPKTITAIYSAFSGAALEGTVVVPEGVEILGEYAFEGCAKVESFELPSTLKNLGDPADLNMSAIGSHAFAGCAALKDFTIPAGMTRIKQETFARCSFTEFTIPENIDFIDYCAFMDCKQLKKVIVGRNEPATLYYEGFKGVDIENAMLVVPEGCVDAYKAADEWCYFGTITDKIDDGGDDGDDGINDACVDSSATAEWFTVRGVRLDNAPSAPGIYIRRQDANTTKTVVK